MADSPDDRHPRPDEEQQVVPATKTRPGGIGRTVFYILLASLALAAIAWLALEIWAYGGSPAP
ncbi:hypothetical protein FHS82_003598 [Pseudochelatococcus lubricantis]|uniref:Uncharacterized protein n=1 Tax=Pseudochelatococcus lubricantis TaxID=1538102 RepID=A0ABX0V3M9_9HYPH|nr:hypothetical protein [Pseudochelatococcus lubricantis]NIJ59737.1 hypothetical protein [Pseudochelatococcus lubricantis]